METNDIKEVKEVNEPADPSPVEGLTEMQASEIAGGNACTTTVTFGFGGNEIRTVFDSFTGALTGTYDGLVDATSHVIERVAGAVKGN